MSPDYRVSDDPAWQPYRDPTTGEVVTVTPAQCAAIAQALSVYLRVVPEDDARNQLIRGQVVAASQALSWIHQKSCLLGRLLYEGKAPLVDAPPTRYSAPDYSVEVPSPSGDSEDIVERVQHGRMPDHPRSHPCAGCGFPVSPSSTFCGECTCEGEGGNG